MAIALGALAIGASGLTVTTLPRPAFPGPAAAPGGTHRLVLVSSRFLAPTLGAEASTGPTFRGLPCWSVPTANRTFFVCGKDADTGRYLVAYTKALDVPLYVFDFTSYALPPRIEPGDRDLVYEQPVWAQEVGGILYVENAHSTYASSSYGRNGYITAIDLSTKRALWRSPALVASAGTFLVAGGYLVTGYGFTAEPDYLYLLDRATGKVVDRLLLPTGPERITRTGALIHVRTYDHAVVVRLRNG